MTEELLAKPEWGRPPPASDRGRPREKKVYGFEKLLDMVRERPGEWAKIAELKGLRSDTVRAQMALRNKIWHYLLSAFPLESWRVVTRRTPETWGDREVWVIFLGDMTAEEAMKLSELRKTAYSIRTFVGKTTTEIAAIRSRARAQINDIQKRQLEQIVR